MHAELPMPGPDEIAHSERLAALLRAEIAQAGGALDFARFMELALYAPGLGYYSAGATKFGAAGDFVTAPELGAVFARCVARAVAPALREAGGGDVVELGPGSGALAVELLLELERLDALPTRYRLLERSGDLRSRQRELVDTRCAHLLSRIDWIDAPPSEKWSGVLLANEVADALPVRLFALRTTGTFARAVRVDDEGNFGWCEIPAEASLCSLLDAVIGDPARLQRPYFAEICPMLAPWLTEVTRTLERGSALFVDYGYADGDHYRANRQSGTLRCHFRHRAHDDPLILVGLQDITAWVDFDALARAGTGAGFEIAAHATQAQFLIAHDLEGVFATAYSAASDERQRYALAQQVKRLTLPDEMGERFRVMQLRRTGR